MSYGLPPAYSNAPGTASQLLQQGASGSSTGAAEPSEFKIYPQATSFIPGIREFERTAIPITDRQVTAIHPPHILPLFHQWARKTPPEISLCHPTLRMALFSPAFCFALLEMNLPF